jgi:uronate dehydrogenase
MMGTVLITGASGNLGGKLRRHLEGRYPLRLLDRDPAGDPAVLAADLSVWGSWADAFAGVDVVVHLAADPTANQTWAALIAPNLDALVNAYLAAVRHGVRRFVFASSNHVMGGYKDRPEAGPITTELPPLPGTRYQVSGEARSSDAYAAGKLFGERLGACLAAAHGLEVIAVRLGWVWRGDNRPEDLPADRERWYHEMWLSNRDFCQLMERCLLAELPQRFVIVNGMSANAGMRWDIDETRRLLGYAPADDVTRGKRDIENPR